MSAAARPVRPTFSVIVAVHDVADHVAAAIASLRAQTRKDFEAIVVIDGGEDDSGPRARAAAQGDRRFRFIEQDNRGLGAARNAGLERARGDFIAFLDGDDRFAPAFLERLHAALEETGADWAACAIRLVHPGGESLHSAIHGAPELPGDRRVRRVALDDWAEVVRLFPSAWNKLYRRVLIEGLRFDAGWYEDHTFFQRAVARTDAIAWLPEPLHLHTRGRAGQITGTDSERVFEQITVLERCAGIIGGSEKSGRRAGLARLASRVMHERARVLRDPSRRARFAAACRDFLAHHGLAYTPEWDADISRVWGMVIAGTLPLSVVIPSDGDAAMLTRTLDALKAQAMPDFEVIVVADAGCEAQACAGVEAALAAADLPCARLEIQPGQGAGAARNHALALVGGEYVVFCDAGDHLCPATFARWCEGMVRAGADFGLACFRIGLGGESVHSGFHDLPGLDAAGLASGPIDLSPEDALCVHAHPSAKIFRRAFVEDHGIRFGTGALPEWVAVLRAGLAAARVQYFGESDVEIGEEPAARRLWRAPVSARDLARALDALVRAVPRGHAACLPAGWRRRLFARAIWEKLRFAEYPDPAAAQDFAAAARRAVRWRRLDRAATPLDPFVDEQVAAIMGGSPPPPPPRLGVPEGARALGFTPVPEGAVLACRVDFASADFANISFLDAVRMTVPFHLSLRAREGVVAFNRHDGGWGTESRRPLPSTAPLRLELRIAPGAVLVHIDGQEILRDAAQDFRGLERIALAEFQGGIDTGSVAISGVQEARAAEPELGARLTLRLRAPDPQTLTGARLEIPGTEDPPAPVMREAPFLAPGTRQRMAELAVALPGRIWRGVRADGALIVRLHCPGAPAMALRLTRPALARRIAALLSDHDLRRDPFAAMQAIEHVRFAGIEALLPPRARAALAEAAAFYRLGAFLHPQGAPDLAPPGSPDGDMPEDDPDYAAVTAARGCFTRSMRLAPDSDARALLETRLDAAGMSHQARRGVVLALCEYFCAQDRFPDLFAAARARGLEAFDPDPGAGNLHNSTILPFLALQGRWDAAAEAIAGLGPGEDGWIVTPALAWTARRAITAEVRDAAGSAGREAVLRAFMAFLAARAPDYREHTPCEALIGATAGILRARARLPASLAGEMERLALRVHGLSPHFWTCLDSAARSPALDAGRAAFDEITARVRGGQGEIDAALAFFERHANPDVARFRRELLGPAGIEAGHERPPAPEALARALGDPGEAALRWLAHPEGAGDAALAEMAARALSGRHPHVAHAPRYGLQVDLGRRAGALAAHLAAGGTAPTTAEIDALAADLALLATPEDGMLGLGLALRLIGVLERADAVQAGARMTGHLERMGQGADGAAPAPALAMALWAGRACSAGPLARRARALFPRASAALPAALPGGVLWPGASPVFDTIVVILSCRAHLDSRLPALRAGWLGLLGTLGVPHVVAVGDGGGARDGDIVQLDAPDDYEGLPDKTLAAIRWVHDHTPFAHMLKIDDDCFLEPEEFFHSLSYAKFDYYGRRLNRARGQMDRAWHCAKARSPRGRFELDKSPEPSSYADGGTGYALSRRAMAAALDAARSPEGRALRGASFMEDKLLGDLLALGGIALADEDYHVSIRRRTHARAQPVAMWENGFHPSRAAPVKLVHLDTHRDQGEVLAGRARSDLWPRKIWPTHLPVTLGHQSNALEYLGGGAALERARAAPVAVVAVMRNEMFMASHFLAHYRKLGVEAFLIADNLSDDGTREYLARQPDVALFSVDTDYAQAQYGTLWQQALIAHFRLGRWSLIADADELLVWQDTRRESLPELLARPEFADADAARIFMLDMYPQGPLERADFASGDPFGEAGFLDREPFLTDWPGRGAYANTPTWTSALRHRLIPGSRTDLFVAQKFALVKYRPWMRFAAGLHFAAEQRLAPRELFFGHFKYNADFARKVRAEVARAQHFNDAEEYRRYLALIAQGREVIFDPAVSVPWQEAAFVRHRLG